MVQREATPGRPQDGPYPATLDEVAESITDAVWSIAFPSGRAAAAQDIRSFADQNPGYSNDNPGIQGLYDAEAIAISGLDPHGLAKPPSPGPTTAPANPVNQ